MLTPADFNEKQAVFAFLNRGERLGFRNDNIVITDPDGDVRYQSTCYRLFAVFVAGHAVITSGLLQRSERFGFSIVLMTHSLRVYGVWPAGTDGNVLLRTRQYRYDSLDIARRLVDNKIGNQAVVLKSIRKKSETSKAAIELLSGYRKRITDSDFSLRELLGIEGIAAREYFDALLKDHGWTARRPRVKHDMINCLMDIGYTLLFNYVEGLLRVFGFDVFKGVLHREFYHRKSLVCDLVEPFRPLIDARIRKALNLGQCHEDDFDIVRHQYRLYGKKAAPYIAWLMEPLIEHRLELFTYVRDYYRAFMRDKRIDEYPYYRITG